MKNTSDVSRRRYGFVFVERISMDSEVRDVISRASWIRARNFVESSRRGAKYVPVSRRTHVQILPVRDVEADDEER